MSECPKTQMAFQVTLTGNIKFQIMDYGVTKYSVLAQSLIPDSDVEIVYIKTYRPENGEITFLCVFQC